MNRYLIASILSPALLLSTLLPRAEAAGKHDMQGMDMQNDTQGPIATLRKTKHRSGDALHEGRHMDMGRI